MPEIKPWLLTVFPFSHIAAGVSLIGEEDTMKYRPKEVRARPITYKPLDLINALLSIIPWCLLAYISDLVYPCSSYLKESAEGLDFSWNGWIAKIMLRDLIVSGSIELGWSWWVDYSFMTKKMRPFKFNMEYQSTQSYWREIPNSIGTILSGTVMEVLVLWLYATGRVDNYFYTDNLWNDLFTHKWSWFIIIGLVPWWRHAHFYFTHRMMHPWNTKYFPDVG